MIQNVKSILNLKLLLVNKSWILPIALILKKNRNRQITTP
jgi:hypothetical protein